jgi:hypothetical protein
MVGPSIRVTAVGEETLWIFSYVISNWLRHYATSRKVAGSSLDEVDFFLLEVCFYVFCERNFPFHGWDCVLLR